MAMIRYYCTHCSHAFEAEEKENVECPACVWTSSVVRESEHRENEASRPAAVSPRKMFSIPLSLQIAFDAIKPLLILLLVLGLIAVVFLFFKPQAVHLGQKVQSRAAEIKKNSLDIPGSLALQKTSSKKQLTDQPDQGILSETPRPVLSEQEKMILARRIELNPSRELSDLEKELMSRTASLKTGRIEKLPGPVWDIERFKQLLAEQQALYQVPLPRSYRNKLQELFEAKYLGGAQAFAEGRLLEARNLWVESLAFPIYANDIEKHRGVALTMLKSFINDTLSKIGALNGMLVEGPVRDRETKLNGIYEEFQGFLNARNWDAAYDTGQNLLLLADDFDKTAVAVPKVPPYPPSTQIDRDIGKSLYDLLETARPAVADVGSMERDVRMKKQVIETFLPGRFSDAMAHYDAGLAAMDQLQWQAAIDAFAKVIAPAVLQRDSDEKIKILKKIIRAELDSTGVSG